MLKTVVISVLVFFACILKSQNYEPDPVFGDRGSFILNSEFAYSLGYKVIALEDGTYITANIVQDALTRKFSFLLVKFTQNGNIDNAFAENGFYRIDTERTEYPLEIALLPGDRIAYATNFDDNELQLTILNKHGNTLINRKLRDFPNNYVIPVRIYVHKDHVFIAGIYNSKSLDNEQVFIIKTDFNGIMDYTFGDQGLFMSENQLQIDARFQDIAFQDDDIIVFSSRQADEVFSNLYLYRLDHKANFDSDFSEIGIRLIMVDNIPFNGMLHTDSKGDIYIAMFGRPKIMKFNREGFYDISYSTYDPLFPEKMPVSYYSSMQPDNSIMIFGSTKSDIPDQFGKPVIAKLGINGRTDLNFGENGFYITQTQNPSAYFNGVVDKNGNILTVGAQEETTGELSTRSLLARHRLKTTSVVEHDRRGEYILFPNPVYDDHLYLDFQNPFFRPEMIEIIDFFGRKIAHYNASALPEKGSNIRIEIPLGIKYGIYFLKIKNGKHETVERFLVLRAYSN